MKSKFITFGCLTVLGLSLCVGSVFAGYYVTDNADSFNITIRATMAPRRVTFHLPNSADNTCSTYLISQVDAEYGDTLTDISVPSTASFLGFTFVNWYQENTYENVFTNSDAITTDLHLYAKYTRSNVLYDGSTYYASSNSDQIVNAQYVYRTASQTWGVASATNEEDKIDLKSSSGIYKLTYSESTWNILRKVGLNAKNCDWWGNDSYESYVFGTTADHSDWGNIWWSATPSTNCVYVNNSDHKTGSVYIDYSLTYLGVIRCAPSITLSLGDEAGTHPTNSTKQTSLTGYNKDEIYLYWNADNVVPTWGNGD